MPRRNHRAASPRAKKSLGQNFLVDQGYIQRIVSSAAPKKVECILEIGPGRGALTEHLAPLAGRFLAVEKDDVLAEEMRVLLEGFPQATLLHADALELVPADLPEAGPWRIIANLPYNIAARLVLQFLTWGPAHIKNMTVMLQREVALRFCSGPGSRDYGVISILAAIHAEAFHLFHVPPEAFRPRPKVVSSIVQFRLRPEPLVSAEEEELVRRAARAAFSSRRKTLANALSGGLGGAVPRAMLVEALTAAGIDPECRAEQVPIKDFLRLPAILVSAGWEA